MTDADEYVDRVLAMMPPSTPRRSQIALELRAHIAERLADGYDVDTVLEQLGDPGELVDSYLAATLLRPAPFDRRAAAKLVDALVVAAVATVPVVWWYLSMEQPMPWLTLLPPLVILGATVLCLYTIVAEYRSARTVGKQLFGMHVVGESGRRIGIGQAIVRQLPILLSVFFIDVLFALFTDRKQRAFELLSKTRVVLDATGERTA